MSLPYFRLRSVRTQVVDEDLMKTYGVGQKTAHGFLCYKFAYSQWFFIIFGTRTL